MAKKMVQMSHAIADKFPWTTETLAEELGMPLGSFRVWKNKIEKEETIKRPAVPSMFCIQDPDHGIRLRYSDSYLEKLKELRGTVNKRQKKGISQSSMKHALLTVTIPIFDRMIADILIKKFQNDRGITEHMKDHINSIAKPALGKLEELKRRHEKEMQEALTEL